MSKSGKRTGASDQPISWVMDYLFSRLHLEFTDYEAADVRRVLWPSTEALYAETSPIFLSDGIPKKLLKFRSEVMARDGFLPLKYFFESCPASVDCPKLLVAEDLAWIVPSAWRARIGTYRVRSKTRSGKTPPDRILMAAPLRPAFALGFEDRPFLDFVEKLQEKWGIEAFRKIRWLMWMPVRDTSCVDQDDRFLEHLTIIMRDFGAQVDFVSWEDLSHLHDLRGWGFVEFNCKTMIAESYVKHFALSKGAQWIEPFEVSELSSAGARIEALSPYHELVVHSALPREVARRQVTASSLARIERLVDYDEGIGRRTKKLILATVGALTSG